MDEQTSRRKESKAGKKDYHKLYTQPHEPVISFASTCNKVVSGSDITSQMKADDFSAGKVLKKEQGSTKKHDKDGDDILGSDQDIFAKPKKTRRQKSSSSRERTSLASRSPEIQSPLQRQKLRQSMSHISPRKHFSLSMTGSPEKKRRHTVSMTREDMEKLQVAIDHNQKRKKTKKTKKGEEQKDCSPSKVPHSKMGEIELNDRAIDQIKKENKLSCRKRHHNSEDQGPNMVDEASTAKRNESGDCSHAFNNYMSGKQGGKPCEDFRKLDEMYNPSQELFTDIESGNETDTRATVQRTVSRFLSSQEAQNDFRTPNSHMVQSSSLTAGVLDSESEVSDSFDDEANETVLEKEIRSFFESKKQHSPRGHREVVPASKIVRTSIQQGTVDEISDESEVICAGQKMWSQTECADVIEEYSQRSTPDGICDLEDGQRLSENTTNTSSQGVAAESENVLKQDEEGGDNCDDIVSREEESENRLENSSQKCSSHAQQDVEMAATSEEYDKSLSSDIEIREPNDANRMLFHSTPAEPTHQHHSELQNEQALNACLTEAEMEERMFCLYCHKDTVPQILEALKACETIDGSTLASANLNDGPVCIKVIRGKVFEDQAEKTSSEASPVLFEENSDDIDMDMETEDVEQLTKQSRRDSAKRNREALDEPKMKPKKPKKNKKRKKVIANPGNNTLNSRLKVINGPIKGDARKKNEYRWKQEMREQSKCPWSEINMEPSLESDLSILRCLKAAARAALNQRKTHQNRNADFKEEDDPDLGTFVNLASFPDVFMTKKKDWPPFHKVPPSEIQILNGS